MRRFVEINAIELKMGERIDALTWDISDSGVGLLTTVALPVGTKVAINEDGHLIAIGEVINIDPWDVYDLSRLGVRIIEMKESWRK